MVTLIHLYALYLETMGEEVFGEPEDPADGWVDVRMTNPEEGEWDVDFVVIDGQVHYLDLRIRPDLIDGFVDCLVDDLGKEGASAMLSALAQRHDLEFPKSPEESRTD